MLSKHKPLWIALIAAVGILAIAGTVAAYDDPITIRGSTTVNPIIQAIKSSWEADPSHWDLEVQSAGTATGLLPLANQGHSGNTPDRVEVAMASRKIKSSEACGQPGNNVPPCTPGTNGYNITDLDEWAIARDALVAIVPKALYDAGVQNLTKAQLVGIYEGSITNWSAVGGPNKPIVPRARETTSGTYSSWLDLLGPSGLTSAEEAATIAATGLPRLVGNPDVVNAIAANNSGTADQIGYVGIGFMNDSPNAKPIKVDGVQPSENTVYSNNPTVYPDYTMKRLLYLYTVKSSAVIGPDNPYSAQVADLANFVRNDCAGQPIVKTEGFLKMNADPDVDKNLAVNTLDVGQVGLSWQAQGVVCGVGQYRRDIDRNGSVNTLDVGKIGLMWQLTYDPQ